MSDVPTHRDAIDLVAESAPTSHAREEWHPVLTSSRSLLAAFLALASTLGLAPGKAAAQAPPAAEALSSDVAQVRYEALIALQRQPEQAALREEIIHNIHAGPRTDVRQVAAGVLVKWGWLNELRELLGDEDKVTREIALQGLAVVPDHSPASARLAVVGLVPKVAAMIDDPEANVRLRAPFTLLKIGGDPGMVLPAALRLIGDPIYSPAQHASCVVGLGHSRLVPKSIPALANALDHSEPLVRTHAILTLGKVGRPAEAAVPALVRKLNPDAPPFAEGIFLPQAGIKPTVCNLLEALISIGTDDAIQAVVLANERASEVGKDVMERGGFPLHFSLDNLSESDRDLFRNQQAWCAAYAAQQGTIARRMEEIRLKRQENGQPHGDRVDDTEALRQEAESLETRANGLDDLARDAKAEAQERSSRGDISGTAIAMSRYREATLEADRCRREARRLVGRLRAPGSAK